MNALKTAALAVTLIIAIPILLGYGMASETTTEEYHKEISTVNMSDLILNSETDYYGNYNGVANNSLLFQIATSWSDYAVPDYVSVSSNYSSIPVNTPTSGTLALESPTTSTISITSPGTYIGINTDSANYSYYDDYILVSNDANDDPTVYYENNGSFHLTLDSDDYLAFIRNGDVYDAYYYNVYADTFTFIASSEWFKILPYLAISNNYTIAVPEPTTLPTSFAYTIDFGNKEGIAILGENVQVGDFDTLTVLGSSAFLDNTLYSDCLPVSVIVFDTNVTSLNYTYGTATPGTYADPNAGWRLPDPSQALGVGETMSTYWTNAAVCGSVTFDLAFTGDGTVSFTLHDDVNYVDRTYSVRYSSGFLSFINGGSTVPIGAYSHARLVLDIADGIITIYGLNEWSPLGETPTTYYTYKVKLTNTLDEPLRGAFSTVEITDDNNVCNFRVASAETVAGQFPSTNNYTFAPISYYPDTEYFTLYVNSVGIYGDSLTIAGTIFIVSPLHKTVTMEYDSDAGIWTTVFNGTTMTTNSAPTIVFNGEWSATITGSFYENDTHEVTNWVAGGFAFDQDDFILAIILTSVAVFVCLGLMKGVKIGILAVVCGAAGIIAFIIA